MLREFKEFAMRGNVLDMAIGIILGIAFGAIVNSLVQDVIMPPIGFLMGDVDFSDLFINLSGAEYASLEAAKEAGAPVIAYGTFINTVIQFLVIAFVIFLIVREVNRSRQRRAGPPPAPSEKACPHCAMNIPVEARRCPHCTSELAAA